ncbi:MAG: putative nucleic acid-binding Zn-ribbon protein [Planctomycetota bacterium]|jgi:predicted  nucleic acid-binding Zn-ribbon protein
MQDTLRLLHSLQELDEDLYRVREELKRLPAERTKRRSAIDAELQKKVELNAQLREQEGRIKEIEDMTTSQRQRIRKLENEASNSRSDTALIVAYQHEIRTLKRHIAEAEDEGLGLVEKADALRASIEHIDSTVASAEGDFTELDDNVAKEIAAAEAKRDKYEAERKARMGDGTVPKDVLTEYEKLLEAREGQALAMLEDRTCQGCYVGVPTNIYVKLMRAHELVTCPSCLRILYLPEIMG